MQPHRFPGLALLCALALAAACDRGQSALHVTVSGALVLGVHFDAVEVSVARAADGASLYLERLEGADLKALPLSLNLLSGPKTPPGTELHVQLSAFLAGRLVSRIAARETLPQRGVVEVSVAFPLLPDGNLVIASGPAWVRAGDCSQPVVLELRDDAAAPVPVGQTVSLALSVAPAGLTFYADASCTTEVSVLELPAGASQAAFYLRGQTLGGFVAAVTVQPDLALAHPVDVVPNLPSELRFSGASQTVRAGECTSATLGTFDAWGNVSPVESGLAVTLSSGVAGALSFFSDPACATPVSAVSLAAGQSQATFHWKGVRGGATNLQATASGVMATAQAHAVIPMVRSGSCTLANGASSVDCAISPPHQVISESFLVFQSASADPRPSQSSVRCRIQSASSVRCRRTGDIGDVSIRWYTAEVPGRARVQQLDVACPGGTAQLDVPIQPVTNPSSTFLLWSSEKFGSLVSEDDAAAARLLNASTVRFSFGIDCVTNWRTWLQVVELEDATVERGVIGAVSGTSITVSNLPSANLSSTALLYSLTRTAETGLCHSMVKGVLTSPTALQFTRGAGAACGANAIGSINWERVDLGALGEVQQIATTMSAGTEVASTTITAVDPTRSIAFAGGQSASGQALGEGSTDGGTAGEMSAIHTLNGNSLQLTREASGGAARWGSYVIQLNP